MSDAGRSLRRSPGFARGVAVYGIGIFTPMILVAMQFGGAVADVDSPYIAQRLGAIRGSIFIDLFLVLGFAVGIVAIAKISEIHMQITGFLCMVAGLVLIALGAAHTQERYLIVAGFMLFNTMLNAGPNLTTFTLPSSVFPVRMRASGAGLAAACGKLGATTGVFCFPVVLTYLGLTATLVAVAVLSFLGAAITYLFRVPPISDIAQA